MVSFPKPPRRPSKPSNARDHSDQRDMEITPIKIHDLKELLITLLSTKTLFEYCIFVWGPPGIGKTALMRQITAELNLSLNVLMLNQLEPSDIKETAAALRSMAEESLSEELSGLVAGGSLSNGAPAPAPAAASAAGGGDEYVLLTGTLEKAASGKKKGYKKRHFKLGKNTLTYVASSKPDAKVLGIIQLSGGSVKQNKLDIVVVDGSGNSNGACIFSVI